MTTLRQLFVFPENAGAFGPERLQKIEQALAEDKRSNLPWYLRFIVGLGAWIASAFFIGFFLMLIGAEDEHRTSFGAIGVVLLVLSVVVARLNLGLFVGQCCLAANLAGQALTYVGFIPDNGTIGDAALLSIILAVAIYTLYPDFLPRLITSLVALQFSLAWINPGAFGGIFEGSLHFGHLVVFVVSAYWLLHLALIIGCLMKGHRWSATAAPLGYAAVASLAIWQLQNMVRFWIMATSEPSGVVIHSVFSWYAYLNPAITALTLIGVVAWAAGGIEACRRRPLPFAALAGALVVIIALGAHGIMLPLLLITLGFFIESNVILGLGLILLPVFLFNFYYNLQLDLMAKAFTLAGSGLALLLLRAGLRRWLPADSGEAA